VTELHTEGDFDASGARPGARVSSNASKPTRSLQSDLRKSAALQRTHRRSIDALILACADQHVVVTTEELLAAGIGRNAIARRVRDGKLTRLFRGVFRVGALETAWTWEAAALRACGRHAVLSHHSAAAVSGIRARRSGPIDVTVAAGHRAGQAGIRVHHSPLEPHEITTLAGLLVTSPERTLRDLAGELPQDELDRAANEAQVQRLTTAAGLRSYLARSSSRPGARALREALREEPSVTRSELERVFLALIDRIGLPRPDTNVRVEGYEVDFLWREAGLVVETDGHAAHHTRRAFEHDRRKDARLTAAGYRVLRFTWRQLHDEPEVVAARLAAALSASWPPGTRRA
jgi:very-short-patch-repair endonuclease